MRKKLLLFVFLYVAIFSTNAQITIDGTMNDWDNVPILSEPGVFPMVKVLNDGTNLDYSLHLGNTNTFNINSWFTTDLYLDADNSSTTGHKSDWLFINSGIDYLFQGADAKKYAGTDGAGDWSWVNVGAITKAFSTDAHWTEQRALVSDLTGTALGSIYTVAFPHYYSTNTNNEPDAYLPLNHWDFAQRKGFAVKPRTEVSLAATADFTSANAYYHPFMKDENIADYLDFQSAAWAAQNPLHWASWALDLGSPGEYEFKMTSTASASGQVQLSIVNMATNAVVKSFTEVWYPADAAMTENVYSNIDLSDIPAGRYMLKLTHPTTWDTFLKVEKVTLSKVTTAVNSIDEKKITIKTTNNKIEISSVDLMDIRVYSTTGQQVATANQIKKTTFDLNNNIYIVKINQNGSVYSKKIVLK